MVAYYGGYGNTIIQSKRFGYKLWCLNLENGYLYNSDVYQGKSGRIGAATIYKEEYGVGGLVVLTLLEALPDIPFHHYIDNFFTYEIIGYQEN